MRLKRLCNILLLLMLAGWLHAQNDTTEAVPHSAVKIPQASVYQGMTVKLDLGSSAVVIGVSKGHIQHYELAMNWRLINRLYPTLEGGYVGGTRVQGDTLHYSGQGGFFRVGLDLNPLKKSAAASPHALLVGLRLGTAVQNIHQTNDHIAESAYQGIKADCWGEVVAGCQVDVYKGLTMGWMGRFRVLFTRSNLSAPVDLLAVPAYIPGFGNRDNTGWGLSYYIGYKF